MTTCSSIPRNRYFQSEENPPVIEKAGIIQWQSPIQTGFSENNVARARVFLCPAGWQAPTSIFLHALMSAHDFGYRRIAAKLNACGWNAVMMHLPYHYSRVPHGYPNGALALTAHLPRNGETLRQAVVELRQLITYLKARGSHRFGVIGTSYGGWVGALLSFVEEDLSFLILLQPIADVEHALWQSPALATIRRALITAGISPGITMRHAHLTSPLHGKPLCGGEKVVIIGGAYDAIVPPANLEQLARTWPGSRYVQVNQGHFGYAAMRQAMKQMQLYL